jgi:hypothetical protein
LLERTEDFCDGDAMDGQAEEDFRNSESDDECAGREECSPRTNVKSDPKESLGAFHWNESIQAVSPKTSLVC